MSEREVRTLELSDGTVIPAHVAVCKRCNTLDLGTDFELLAPGIWRLTCPACNNKWTVERP